MSRGVYTNFTVDKVGDRSVNNQHAHNYIFHSFLVKLQSFIQDDHLIGCQLLAPGKWISLHQYSVRKRLQKKFLQGSHSITSRVVGVSLHLLHMMSTFHPPSLHTVTALYHRWVYACIAGVHQKVWGLMHCAQVGVTVSWTDWT